MNGEDLARIGFCPRLRLALSNRQQLMRSLPRSSGVYAILLGAPLHRARGKSDILYIGRGAGADGLRARVSQHLSPGPTQSTNKRILARVLRGEECHVSWIEADTPGDAVRLRRALLLRYAEEHGEGPPENLRV